MNRRKLFNTIRRILAGIIAPFIPVARWRRKVRLNLLSLRPLADPYCWLKLRFGKRRSPSVLIVEPNKCHAVVLPGLARHFADLSYDVSVLAIAPVIESDVFAKVPNDERISIYALCTILIENVLKNAQKLFDVVVLSSTACYFGAGTDDKLYIDYLGFVPSGGKKLLLLEHDLRDAAAPREKNFLNNNQMFVLTGYAHTPKALTVSTHYFGNINVTPKNRDTVRFITVGSMDASCRSGSLLLDAVGKLHEKGITDFCITVVGSGKLDGIPTEHRRYFELKGKLDYPQMYAEMEAADFFLALLDPNDERHDAYRTVKTTGSKLLVLGFRKPFVVNELFAEAYGFDGRNAVIYSGNELAEAMRRAVEMDAGEYDQMQRKLGGFADDIRNESLKNLRLALSVTENIDSSKKAA